MACCPDAEHVLDAFVDAELPSSQLLDVARHAAVCPACDGAIREVAALRQSVAVLVDREAGELDLSGVWPAVEAALPSSARPGARIIAFRRAVPAAPVWGALMAVAASALFWLGRPSPGVAPGLTASGDAASQMVASASARTVRLVNHADIDRLAGKDIAVRREPKNGTTIIWVNHTVEANR